MLILHRKLNEEIVITFDGARIGVIADREVKVDRREIYDKKQADRQQ